MKRLPYAVAAVVGLIATGVFWRTAYPTITWWDSSNYSTAAYTLGVPSPPGSLLLTLLGWPVSHLPFGRSPAHTLNLFAGMLAAVSTALVYLLALELRITAARNHETNENALQTRRFSVPVIIGAVFGALSFAFSATAWEYAIKFTPYILTVVFTGMILWSMLRWWSEADSATSWRWLLLLGLLFGIDFSVHRTNAMLIPAACVWVLLRNPGVLRQWRSVVMPVAGLMAGLSLQFLTLPIAIVSRSPVNFSTPDTFSRLWDFISLSQYGGQFLVSLYPRKSGFWTNQVADILGVLRDNFFQLHGPWGALGALPAVMALVGVIALARRNARLGIAVLLTVLLHAATTVVYFNIPANFFRTFDRHYLPVCFVIAVIAAYGMSELLNIVSRATRDAQRPGVPIALAAGGLGIALAPLVQLRGNWQSHDASGRYFAGDYAANVLNALPPNAIYFTVGDNDTYPVLYMQAVEHMRPDVTLVNLSVLNMSGYPEQMLRLDPSFPVSLLTSARAAAIARPWTDTLVALPVSGSAEQLGLATGTGAFAPLALHVKPQYGDRMLESEVSMLDIVRTNAWRRPITFAITASREGMNWLAPYGRAEGMYWRIVPVLNSLPDVQRVQSNLLTRFTYRGYADSAIVLDPVATRIGVLYYNAVGDLLQVSREMFPLDECQRAVRKLNELVPTARLPGLEAEVPPLVCH